MARDRNTGMGRGGDAGRHDDTAAGARPAARAAHGAEPADGPKDDAEARGRTGPRGRGAASPLEIPLEGWRDVLRRVGGQIGKDNLDLVAAGAAFYGMLALFPALASLVSIYGLISSPAQAQKQMEMLENVLPQQAGQLIGTQMQRIASGSGTALTLGLVFGFVLTIWSSSAGVKSLMTAMNIVYGEPEKRGFIEFNRLALLLTFCLLVFVVIALLAIGFVPAAVQGFNVNGFVGTLINWVRWPLLAAASVGVLSVLYRYSACRARPAWRWVAWGAVVATAVWLAGSALFSWYVANFGHYNATYGSVAAVAVLMLWLWLSAYIVLLGGELNAEMEHQTRLDSTTGEHEPMGRRGAHVADTVGRS